jgi:hypothetical protein
MAFQERSLAPFDLHANAFYQGGRQLFPMFPVVGREWFLNAGSGAASDDGTGGAAAGDGRSWRTARRTMASIFTDPLFSSGDVIFAIGKIREELTAPAGIHGVKIIGASSTRHPDGHTSNNGYVGSAWVPPASPTAATPLLTLIQQGWEVHNMLFDCPVDAAAVKLNRDAGAGDDERDAGHAKFINCRFDSGKVGIENAGGAGFVTVRGCQFYRLTESGGAGIKCTSTSVAVPLNWRIEDNHFANNASHILSSMSYSLIRRNIFGRFTATLSIDIDDQPSANQGEYNVLTENYLTGTYSATAYPPGSNNEWAGNQGVAGVTTADPS